MKIARLIGILSILLQQPKTTAAELAERFEVSTRTIYRDIEVICQAGIPLVTTQGIGGGVAIMDGFKIDRTLLSSADMQAILIGLKTLDSFCTPNNAKRYQQLIDRLCPAGENLLPVNQHILIDLASWDKAALTDKIELLQDAITDSRKVAFVYCAPAGETERLVEPYKLLFQWSSWYLWAWCNLRQDFRLFRLSRMSSLVLVEDFVPRSAPLPDLSVERVFPSRYQVKALIEPDCKWRLIDEYGVDSFQAQPDGRLLFEIGFTDEENIISWLATFGSHAEVLEPVELRRRMLDFAEAICANYR